MYQPVSQQEFKSDIQSTQATMSLPSVLVQDDNSKSTNTTNTNTTSSAGSAIILPVNTTTPVTTVTNKTSSLGLKRSASTAFQEPVVHTSSSFPNLLSSSSFHLPFQSTLSNPGTNGSSTGSDYSGNDDSYSVTPQPQQSIASSGNAITADGTSGFGSGPNSSAQIDLTPITRNGKNLTEKKIRRLEKNRLSARNCRRKKKEYTQNLQREIMMLEGENLRLRLQLQIGQEAEQSTIKEHEKVTEGIDECKLSNT
jgi:hypothetical protein